MEEKYHYDFRYVEFIRNPQLKKENVDQNGGKPDAQNIICIALDYFDVIYAKKVNNLRECMVSENDIPCEAYQSLGLFRKVQEDSEENKEDDPFRVNQEYPFFSIMQVTLAPEAYQGEKFDINQLEDELNKIVLETQIFDENNNVVKFKRKHKIYHTVNTMDFCVVLSSDRMDFAAYLSTRIKALVCCQTEKADPKYAVYMVMGIYNRFEPEKDRVYMNQDTILVARILLNRGLYVEKTLQDKFKSILCEEGKTDRTKKFISTHSLPGRYELSVRIDGSENILGILKMTLEYIMCSFTEEEEEQAAEKLQDGSLQSSEQYNVLKWLLESKNAKYLNLRMFFNTLDCFGMESSLSVSLNEHTRQADPRVETTYANLYKCVKENGALERLDAYLDKLHHMIHTYVTLIPQYDTHINIKMLGECLIHFMKLLQLHIGFVSGKLEKMEDVEKNILWALNYFQQYVRVISSVNSSSFQSPQYEIEKDECSIVKLPIAYMQFLQEMFDTYYNYKENHSMEEEEEEVAYFLKYVPLVIPYMQNSSYDSDFMMLTLLGQNMADEWEKVKSGWSDHIKDSRILMFIICQDMKKYKSASELIVSSFHEMGHYCNRLTREQRNTDLIEVLSEDIAKSITKRAVANSKVSYQQMIAALKTSQEIACLYECVYLGVVGYFHRELRTFVQFPKAIFLEKLWKSFQELTNEFADFGNPSMFDEKFLDDYLDEIAFCFGYCCEGESLEEKRENAGNYLASKWEETEGEINSCLLEIGGDELTEKTRSYLDKARKIVEAVCYRDSANGDLNKQEESNESEMGKEKLDLITKSMNEDANELARYTNTYRKVDITRLRDLLNTSKYVISFCLRFGNGAAFQTAAEENKQWPSNSEMKALAEKRGELLEEIWNNYMASRSLSMTGVPVTFLELLREMHISEESSQNGFKICLNRAISGLSVSESVLELAKSNYEESIADIVMCVNLNLGVKEYLAFVFDMYEKGDNKFLQSVPRFAVVISFLIYVKDAAEYKETEKIQNENELLREVLKKVNQRLTKDFQEQTSEAHLGAIKPSVKKLCNILEKQLIDVQKSKLFRVAFCRAFQLRNRLEFVNGLKEFEKIRDFVRERLEMKLYEKKDEDTKIQNSEIEFILNYYYKNRVQYANKSE